jgi:putative membrane protein
MTSIRVCRSLIVFSSVTALAGAMACAQMQPGGQPSSNETNAPGSNGANSSNMQMQEANQSQGSMQDKSFVYNALQGGMAEVQLGDMAAQKGTSEDVKQFGQKMVSDHTKLNNQMKKVAQQLGVTPPKKMTKKDQELLAQLGNMDSGPEFDNAYIEAMVKDHKKDNEDFRNAIADSQNPSVKQAAQQGDDVIMQHLQLINQIAKNHNLMSSNGKPAPISGQ